jgi:hypothetical protein
VWAQSVQEENGNEFSVATALARLCYLICIPRFWTRNA